MELSPLQDWIVMTFPTVATHRGLIELPESEVERMRGRAMGVVLAVGPMASEFHEGQVLVFDQNLARIVAGQDRHLYRLARACDIIAVVESDEQADEATLAKIKRMETRMKSEMEASAAAANLSVAAGMPRIAQ